VYNKKQKYATTYNEGKHLKSAVFCYSHNKQVPPETASQLNSQMHKTHPKIVSSERKGPSAITFSHCSQR
jgi:hypothetical protein